MMQKTIILSLGGSLIAPDSIDINFLIRFKNTVGHFVKKGFKFVIICGGGMMARNLQQAASKLQNVTDNDLDWLGIYVTKLNAQLVKSMFRGNAEEFIVENPTKKISFKKNIVVAAGWKPGWSTDYDAILLAKNLSIKEVINMSNVDYAYDKDPKKHKDSRKIEKISWKGYTKLIGSKWKAGMNAPFDPVASKEAQKSGIKVYIIGKDLKNLENLLDGKKFRGTTIS